MAADDPSATAAPRVRVVVVDYDGGPLTLACLASLRATDWPADRLELVLVDNASPEPVLDEVRRRDPAVRIVASPVNRGFAGGANLGLVDLDDVDYVAIVNNDVTVDPGWLRPLVGALEGDPTLGAAAPKILFPGSFVEITLDAETTRRGRGDRRSLGVRVSGARVDGHDVWRRSQRVDGFWGPEHGAAPEVEYEWTAAHATLRVPARDGGTAALRLGADRPTHVTLRSGPEERRHRVGPGADWHDAPLGAPPVEVVDNAGSVVTADGYGADRGYLEPDDGRYDEPVDVVAWCGAAALLSTRYLADVGRFDERLFLYYEDLELSRRGARRGWRYRYVPSSTVRHVHSATTGEGSALSHLYNERNRLAVLTIHEPPGEVLRQVTRFALITASYARRDVLAPLLHGRRPHPEIVRRRVRALVAYLRLLPSLVAGRRRGRGGSRVASRAGAAP